MSSTTRRRKTLGLLLCVSLLTLLTACGPSSTAAILAQPGAAGLPPIPAGLRTCFDQVFKMPGKKGTGFTNEQAVSIIGGLRGSELEKTDCGLRLLKFYDDVAAGRK